MCKQCKARAEIVDVLDKYGIRARTNWEDLEHRQICNDDLDLCEICHDLHYIPNLTSKNDDHFICPDCRNVDEDVKTSEETTRRWEKIDGNWEIYKVRAFKDAIKYIK
jgi:hypothetical protein